MSSHEHEQPGEHADAPEATGHPHARSARVQRALDEASAPDPDRNSQERNVAVAIAVLAGLVVLVLILVASGTTGMFHP
jgi:hypothetical protein